MKGKYLTVTLFFAVFYSLVFGLDLSAQGITITGKCTDSAGPLPGVTVKIKGTTLGAATDIDGNYTLEVDSESAVLQFSSIGYAMREEKVGSRRQINVVMKDDEKQLGEVVITGYQTVQKRFAGGTIASIDAEEISELPSSNLAGLLAGKSAGLVSMNLGGAPGAGGAIQIRGNSVVSGSLGDANQFSNPLYVIDGVPTTLEEVAGYGKSNNDFLTSLNVDDIQSIDILKDASAAAIYGSRGANGVIIIKTKTGIVGKMRVEVKANVGITMRPSLTKTMLGVTERRMKMQLINDTWDYSSKASSLPILLTDSLNPSFNNSEDYQGMFYQNGVYQDYNVAIRGGSEELNYRLSLGYYGEDGIVKETDHERFSMTLNVTQRPWGDIVDNQTIVTASYEDRNPGMGNFSGRNNFPVSLYNMKSSLLELSDDQRSYLSGSLSDYFREHTMVNMQVANNMNVKIWKGLIFNSNASVHFRSVKQNNYQPSVIRADGKGYANYLHDQQFRYNLDHFLGFTDYIAEGHHLNVLAGISYENSRIDEMDLEAYGGSGDMIHTINHFRQEDITGSTAIKQNAMIGYWTRIGYRFLDRYNVDFNIRRDGSSRFGKNKRYGSFPSGAVYWIFSDEPFMEFSKDWLSFGKVKYSYGKNGRQFSNDYLRYNMYNMSFEGFQWLSKGQNMSGNTYNGVLASIPNFKALADYNLTWEESTQSDLGVDLEFFKNRLYVTANYYNKNTNAMLFDVEFPDYTGFEEVKANVAGVRNTGWELSIDAHLLPRNNDLTVQVNAGFAGNKQVITKLPNGNRDYYVSDYGYTVGKPGPLFRGLVYKGSLKSLDDLPVNPFTGKPLDLTKGGTWGTAKPGYPWWEDMSGDYLVSDNAYQDVVLADYDPNPTLTGNLNINVRYKEWQVRANSYFAFGHDVYDEVSQKIFGRFDGGNWVQGSLINVPDYDFWSAENPNGHMPAIVPPGGSSPYTYSFRSGSTLWWEKGDYWKLNDITIAYNFKRDWLRKHLKLERLYVYATVWNVWQWQSAKKISDVSMYDSRGRVYGDGYPQPRKFTFGLNVEF